MEEAKKLLSDVITKLAESAAQAIATKVKDYFVDREFKDQIDIGLAFEEYLNKVYDTHSKSKTILYDAKPRELSSFYIPANLSQDVYEPYHTRYSYNLFEEYNASTRSITDVFNQYNKIVVTGIGGMGKTMMMKYLCANSIKDGYKIPVFISLRRFNKAKTNKRSFEELIYDQLKTFGFRLDYKYFEYSLSGDRYLFLFDGYDEICESKRANLSFEISDFAKQYSENTFVISSRKIEGIYSFDDFIQFSICPLTRKQSIQLIWRLDFDYEIKKRFVDELTDKFYDKYKSFVSVPLLLSILFLTYVSNTKLPETLKEFYEKAFETLLFKHDRMKIGFERVLSSRLSFEAFRTIFLSFCFTTFFKEMYSFSYRDLASMLSFISKKVEIGFDEDAYIRDLVDISCMLIRDGQEFIFIHRSFQEYFAAVLVANKPDEEQKALCSSYLEYKANSRRTIEKSGNIFTYKMHVNDDYNMYHDFLEMLRSVEPDRFEYIVLAPIALKIKKAYQKQNEDLFLTAVRYSEILHFLFIPTAKDEYSFDITECISYEQELQLIRYYDQDTTSALKEIRKTDKSLANQLIQKRVFSRLKQYIDEYSLVTTNGRNGLFVLNIMKIYAIAMVQYEKKYSQIGHMIDFSEMIDDFICKSPKNNTLKSNG